MKCKDCIFWAKVDLGKKHIGLDHMCTNPGKKIRKGCILLTAAEYECRKCEKKEETAKCEK